jgi:hypothetical protein
MTSGSKMSSATSIDPQTKPAPVPASPPPVRVPWLLVTPLSLAATAAIYLFAVSRAHVGAGSVLVVLAAAAFGAVAIQIWKSLAALIAASAPGETRAVRSHRRRRELEREKQMVLKAIKELEFDRAMGKISADDYKEAHANYRTRAVRILAELDADSSGYREIIERELAERLSRRDGAGAAVEGASAPAPAVPAVVREQPGLCACGVQNDDDAVFCKKCGARLAPADPRPAS